MRKVSMGSYSTRASRLNTRVRTESKPAGKTKTKKKRRSIVNKKLLGIFVFVLIAGLLGFGYLRLQEVNSRVEKFDEGGNKIECTNILNPSCWTEAFKPQLKQTGGFTNGLVLGLDTRANRGSLKNTDSIIFFSFNHKTQQTMLVSIPRDFYVPVYATKINAIYAFTGDRNPDDPFFYIKETVSQITGKPIHYFGTIRFEGVIEGIAELGGVKVCPEDAFTAMYPNDKATASSPDQWLYYDFKEGCQTVKGEKALVYARFRYLRSGPSYLASDFSRARRQQEIIEAAKDKALKEDLSIAERAEKYWALMQTFNKNATVYDITFEDLLAGLAFLDSADRDPINVVLDPAFGGYSALIASTSHPSAGYIIQAHDSSYSAIQAELNKIWKNADFYKEEPKILVRNQSNQKLLPDSHPVVKLRNNIAYYEFYDYINQKATDQFTGIKLFDFTAGKKPGSLEIIRKFLKIDEVEDLPEQYGIERSGKKEDFLIVVGPPAPKSTNSPAPTPE